MKVNLYICFVFVLSFWRLPAQISFSEISSSQNINVSHGNGAFVGGMSFFDFNNDGWDDLSYASQDGDPLYFFQNNSGVFVSISFDGVDNDSDTRQLNWVDIDNDGDNDLFVVSNNASNQLYLNDGFMNFTDITESSGLSTSIMNSWGGSWGDYNNDGYLDVFISNRDMANGLQPNLLYRNNGDATFTDVSSSAGISNLNHLSLCASFFDFNNDGWQDIYIANDRVTTSNILYKNNGNGTFTDVSTGSGTDVFVDAMSTTIGDYNSDGFLDIYVTNTQPGNYFFENNGDETFTNIASSNGTLFQSFAWGAVFLDADNDSDLDLYVSGMRDGTSGQLPSAFYQNDNGIFTIPSSAGFSTDIAESYSNAIGDINNDGLPDISVLNNEPDNHFLWLNSNTEFNNWLKITLEGSTTNRMGIGSWIEISIENNKQYRYTLNGEGYTSQNSGAEFFGVGNYTTLDYVKVTWLSGVEDILYNVPVNQTLHIVESSTLSQNKVSETIFNIYPNPSQDIIHIDSNSSLYQVELFDVLGARVFLKERLEFGSQIDIRHLSSGVYYLIARSADLSLHKKIVKN